MNVLDNLNRGTQVVETVEHTEPGPGVAACDTENLPWGLPVAFSEGLPRYHGRHRGSYSTLQSSSDAEAVAEWLREKASDSKPTARAYRREAERLLIWAARQHQKSLSDLDRNDYVAYREFLSNPGPEWIMDKRYNRQQSNWRPFMGPLSTKSSYYALTVVFSLVKFLVDTGWLKANPMPSPKKPKGITFNPQARSLSAQQKDYVYKGVEQMSDGSAVQRLQKARAKWVLSFFLKSAARATEACTHTMNDIKRVPIKASSIWVWQVIGKGNKESMVPVSQSLITAMVEFRTAMGLSPYPSVGEGIPLIPSLRNVNRNGEFDFENLESVTSRQALRIVKERMAAGAAIATHAGDCHEAAALENSASTHWLRHTILREVADRTGDMRIVQAMGRHANINTSAIYSTKDLADLASALEDL